jgi:hypothetical protein
MSEHRLATDDIAQWLGYGGRLSLWRQSFRFQPQGHGHLKGSGA